MVTTSSFGLGRNESTGPGLVVTKDLADVTENNTKRNKEIASRIIFVIDLYFELKWFGDEQKGRSLLFVWTEAKQ